MLDLDRRDWGNFSANIEFLKRTKMLTKPRKVLEIGCGQGRLLDALQRNGHTTHGIDLSQEALDNCPIGLDVRIGEGSDLPFPDSEFDLVLSFDVFEHIPESDKHLAEVARVLRPKGNYLLQTPNKWTNVPFEMIRWSQKYGPLRMFEFLKPPQHCSLHNYWQLKKRFKHNGFLVDFYDIEVVNEYFVDKVQAFTGNLGVSMLKVINPDRLPRPLRTNFYLKATKVGE